MARPAGNGGPFFKRDDPRPTRQRALVFWLLKIGCDRKVQSCRHRRHAHDMAVPFVKLHRHVGPYTTRAAKLDRPVIVRRFNVLDGHSALQRVNKFETVQHPQPRQLRCQSQTSRMAKARQLQFYAAWVCGFACCPFRHLVELDRATHKDHPSYAGRFMGQAAQMGGCATVGSSVFDGQIGPDLGRIFEHDTHVAGGRPRVYWTFD